MNTNQKISATIIATALLSIISPAMAETKTESNSYNQVSFQTEVKVEVTNDEVQASLYKKAQSGDTQKLANELNTAINKALKISKKYPTVTVTTGHQSTYPRYDKKSKIKGWTGQSSINIKSTDITATSKLIAELQEHLVLDNLNFGVSESRQDEIEKRLMTKASKAFQSQADTMVTAWGATGYKLVTVNLNTGSNYYPRPAPMMRTTTELSAGASVSNQNFESGNSSISVTANGTIELMKE